MNMIKLAKCLKQDAKREYFEFVLSPLHAKTRFFEYFLHLSYKSVIKMWQVRAPEQRVKDLERKQKFQAPFCERLGINKNMLTQNCDNS